MIPTINLLSALAKHRMLGVAGEKLRVRLGLKTTSAVSGVAFVNAVRRSVRGENIKAMNASSERFTA